MMSEIEDLLERMLKGFEKVIQPGDLSPRGRAMANVSSVQSRRTIVRKYAEMETEIAWLRAEITELLEVCSRTLETAEDDTDGLWLAEIELLRRLPTVIAGAESEATGSERSLDGLASRGQKEQMWHGRSYPFCPFCGYRADPRMSGSFRAFKDHMSRCNYHPAGAEIERLRTALEAVVHYTSRKDEDGCCFPLNAEEVEYLDEIVDAALEGVGDQRQHLDHDENEVP